MAAAMEARKDAVAASNSSSGSSGGHRRLTWTAAYESVRHDDESDAASFAVGLTPHARGRRRLMAATRVLALRTVNDAASAYFPCIVETGLIGNWASNFAWTSKCIWGFEYTYQYSVR